jgi:N-acetylneuraminic acid mutarotase
MNARYILVALLALAGCGLDNSNKNKCAVQEDCTDGNVCNLVTGICEEPGQCTPATCEDKCGTLDDGCGGTLVCGCTAPEVCGSDKTCALPPPHCTNGVWDAGMGETDKDCGGACAGCEAGQKCNAPTDCAAGSCEDNVCVAGSWARVADMPTTRQYAGAVYAPDGLIYVIGGIRNSNPGGITGVVEAYNPVTDSWTTRAPMLTPRYGFAAVVGSDGLIYTIGGPYNDSQPPYQDGQSVLVEAYNPATNTWSPMPSLPNGRYHPAAVAAPDGNIYVTGGFSVAPTETLGSIARFTPGGSSWTTLSPIMTSARSAHGVVVGDGGKIYAVAGYNGSQELTTLEHYTPGGLGWNTAPPLALARKHATAAFAANKLYVIGGNAWINSGIPYASSVEAYDPSTNSWSEVASLPQGRWAHASAVSPQGKIYVFGGTRAVANPQVPNQGGDTKVTEVFTP